MMLQKLCYRLSYIQTLSIDAEIHTQRKKPHDRLQRPSSLTPPHPIFMSQVPLKSHPLLSKTLSNPSSSAQIDNSSFDNMILSSILYLKGSFLFISVFLPYYVSFVIYNILLTALSPLRFFASSHSSESFTHTLSLKSSIYINMRLSAIYISWPEIRRRLGEMRRGLCRNY